MTDVRCLAIASILVGALPALAADKPATSSTLPAVQAPAPGTASRLPATTPGAAASAAAASAGVGTPLKCTVAVVHKGSNWGGGGSYRSIRATNDRGARQPLAVGSKIKWSSMVSVLKRSGEHVLVAALLPGQSVEVGQTEHVQPAVDPVDAWKGVPPPPAPTCEAKLLP